MYLYGFHDTNDLPADISVRQPTRPHHASIPHPARPLLKRPPHARLNEQLARAASQIIQPLGIPGRVPSLGIRQSDEGTAILGRTSHVDVPQHFQYARTDDRA